VGLQLRPGARQVVLPHPPIGEHLESPLLGSLVESHSEAAAPTSENIAPTA
jgi:hypothetical protein